MATYHPIMTDSDGKHVFISYVREDSDRVDSLCAVLEAAQLPYWRARSALGPGDAWRAKIRQAIREGSLVFLACFSDNSRAKDKSYMNEELTLAVDEFRQMPLGRTWLIPVRFDPGDVPDWDLGAGRVLSDLNYSDLFGPEQVANAARLVTTIYRLTGEKRPDPATSLAAVPQATSADRTDLLKLLTKEMLLDPSRRIELDDLITQEVQRVNAVLKDGAQVAGPLRGANEEQLVHIAGRAKELWQLTAPFCSSLQVAARWGSQESLGPWANGLRSFVATAMRVEGGVEALLELRHLPGMVSIMTAGLACVSSGNWKNLKVLAADPTVRDRYESKPLSILEATHPYKPFEGTTDLVTNALARATIQQRDVADAAKDFTERRNDKYLTPEAEWLHYILRPIFLDQLPDDDAYDSEFDRTEVMLGTLAQDAMSVRVPGNPNWGRFHWYGRSFWRAGHHYGKPVEDFAHEFATQGALWGPLLGNLFGGDEDRARSALEICGKDF
jgi:TIR domain